MGNSLGKLFTITSFGESHGKCVGVVIDGCPAGLPLSQEDVQKEVDKRRPQGVPGATKRAEEDKVEILSGLFSGYTTGAPICMVAWNRDLDSSHYERIKSTPRPGHADYTAFIRYGGFNDFRGGGRFSGRITATFVMAGAVAKKLLGTLGTEVIAHTLEIGGVRAELKPVNEMRENVAKNPLHCGDLKAAEEMAKAIEKARGQQDSVGGIIEGIALNVPAGLGDPVFDTIEGELTRALFAIPAVKGVESGSGFASARMRGSENNDPFTIVDGKIATVTNNAGGVLGGITSGMPVVIRVAIKPTPTISRDQRTVDMTTMNETDLAVRGRHDSCIVPRAVPVVESMMSITLCDFALMAGLIPRVIK